MCFKMKRYWKRIYYKKALQIILQRIGIAYSVSQNSLERGLLPVINTNTPLYVCKLDALLKAWD